jgi:anhydro-N-acetylmuramic acid kinase
MKYHIQQLAAIAEKPVRNIIGLMSGTSLDGLDVAWCRFSGSGRDTRVEVHRFATVPYDEGFKSEVQRVFAKKNVDFQHLTLLNVIVAEHHAALVLHCLDQWGASPADIDLVASHGQTVFHAPRIFHHLPDYPNATLQIGDGDHMAQRMGIITFSDFRQKHIAAGGEGAPLALYGDYLLFSQPGEDRFLLNLGGIANFTFLPGDGQTTKVFATDTGPGNTLLDAFARRIANQPFDEGARLATAGTVDAGLLAALKTEPFFALPFPKTIGPELFGPDWVLAAAANAGFDTATRPHDLMATLTRLTADTVAEALGRVKTTNDQKVLYLSGGGAHNPLITDFLQKNLSDWTMRPMADLGVHGDAKEAVLFAVLANETIAGTFDSTTILGGLPLVSMGKISLPG